MIRRRDDSTARVPLNIFAPYHLTGSAVGVPAKHRCALPAYRTLVHPERWIWKWALDWSHDWQQQHLLQVITPDVMECVPLFVRSVFVWLSVISKLTLMESPCQDGRLTLTSEAMSHDLSSIMASLLRSAPNAGYIAVVFLPALAHCNVSHMNHRLSGISGKPFSVL